MIRFPKRSFRRGRAALDLLLDTHTFLWFFLDDPRLREPQRARLRDLHNRLFLSAVSLYEIGIKARLGKLTRSDEINARLDTIYRDFDVLELAVDSRHTILASRFESTHRDPFDRILAAQSIVEGLPVMTTDAEFAGLGAQTIW